MPLKIKPIIIYVILLGCLGFIFSNLVIKDFFNILSGEGDTDHWEFSGFYVLHNLTWFPIPHLNLINDQGFYPYSGNHVFLPWMLEKDIFYAAFNYFGLQFQLQIYYLITLFITAIGTLILLFRDYGWIRASMVSFLIPFFNCYTIAKYPSHFSYTVFHWTVLSFVVDFLLVKRVVFRQELSFRLLLFRTLLFFLSFSQELGYVAGFSLTSAFVSGAFIIGLITYRLIIQELQISNIKAWLYKIFSEIKTHPIAVFLMTGLICLSAYIYIPLVAQIKKNATSFNLSEIDNFGYWIHPIRLFFPLFEKHFNSQDALNLLSIQDIPETIYDGRPGLFLVVLGFLGIWQSRKTISIYLPLLTIFILCIFFMPLSPVVFGLAYLRQWLFLLFWGIFLFLARKRKALFFGILATAIVTYSYKPGYFPSLMIPTLRAFPWFAFNRLGGRSTIIYPVILCLFSLGIDLNLWKIWAKRSVIFFLIGLSALEIGSFYKFGISYEPYLLNQNFFQYMNYVKQQPGEAVFDWPFCVTGGNAVGALQGLCPYYSRNATVFTFRRFYNKKVIGQYFGRLHPDQLKPYLEAGWDRLFFPNHPRLFEATGQLRCFQKDEWEFIQDFFKYNDFSGINLYVELMPESCVAEFQQRFGPPAVETQIPWAGRVQFIPKPAELRKEVNPELGKKLKLKSALGVLDRNEGDLIQTPFPYTVHLKGFGLVDNEPDRTPGRMVTDSKLTIEFNLSEAQPIHFHFQLVNLVENRTISLSANRVTLKQLQTPSVNVSTASIEEDIVFQGVAGLNQMQFLFDPEKTPVSTLNPRFFGTFRELKILPAN